MAHDLALPRLSLPCRDIFFSEKLFQNKKVFDIDLAQIGVAQTFLE